VCKYLFHTHFLKHLFPIFSWRSKLNSSQIVKRRSTPETRAGQYMCAECGKIFDTKAEVDVHRFREHKSRIKSMHNNLNGLYTE